jgi:hypothetical protein
MTPWPAVNPAKPIRIAAPVDGGQCDGDLADIVGVRQARR